jgi:hypothetical protein
MSTHENGTLPALQQISVIELSPLYGEIADSWPERRQPKVDAVKRTSTTVRCGI